MARSPYSQIELSINGLLTQKEAEAWIEDHKLELDHYIDNESPWSVNEMVKMHPLTTTWMATLKAVR